MKKPHIKLSIYVALCCLSVLSTQAQKLPKVQEGGVYAPANIKIDGKPAEWNNQFQAYNKATQIFYTMANDGDNLYLALQAKDPDAINRIVGGGIVLSIQRSEDKNDANKISITYPKYGPSNLPVVCFYYLGPQPRVFGLDTTAKTRDSITKDRNNLISTKLKWIGVQGVKGIDPEISIYNGDGIKAACSIDNKDIYTLEMAIPIKHLGLSVSNADKFTYHLQVNGSKAQNGGLRQVVASTQEEARMVYNQAVARLSAVTDFWGAYQLVNK